MANFKDIIKLTKDQEGKVFIMDEQGEVQLVIVDVREYQKLVQTKSGSVQKDTESINREITEAQLMENLPVGEIDTKAVLAADPRARVDLRSEVVDPNFNFDAAPGEEYETISPDFDDI